MITKKDLKEAEKYYKCLSRVEKIIRGLEMDFQNTKEDIEMEDRIPYKSAANITNDVPYNGGARIAQQDVYLDSTLQLDPEEENLIEKICAIRDLERILESALEYGAMQAKQSTRPKALKALRAALEKGVNVLDTDEYDISAPTFYKCRKHALIRAAESIQKLRAEESVALTIFDKDNNEKKKEKNKRE